MPAFKEFDIALANFKNYPHWPVKILKVSKDSKGKPSYLVFCYGTHDEYRLVEANLAEYNPSVSRTSTKQTAGVKAAFEELKNSPDIYKSLSKTYNALTIKESNTGECASLMDKITSTELDLEKTKRELLQNITKKVNERFSDADSFRQSSHDIICQIYDAITLDYQPKFEKIEQSLKTLRNQIINQEEKIMKIEMKLDSFEQEVLLDSLILHGVKQQSGSDLQSTILQVFITKMNLTEINVAQIRNIYRFKISPALTDASLNDKVPPVLVKFVNSDIAKKVFKAKARLASSGIFLSEALTKRRREILYAAKDRFGHRNVWTDRGQILARPNGESVTKKIHTLADCV